MDEDESRKQAIKRLKERSDFKTHLVVYVIVNAFLIGVWAAAGGGYFWPIWVIMGWGIGLAFHAWNVYGAPKGGPTEEQIQAEIRRVEGDGSST